MLFYILVFTLSWIVWLVFADKDRWREILPVCIFAKCLVIILAILQISRNPETGEIVVK